MKKQVSKSESVAQTVNAAIVKEQPKAVKTKQDPVSSIEAILAHAEKLQRVKRKVEWFIKKEEELENVKDAYRDYLEKRTDEELFLETQPDLFDFELALYSKGKDYGRSERVVEIQNPNVINAFVRTMLDYIVAKKNEAIREIEQMEAEYAKKIISQYS